MISHNVADRPSSHQIQEQHTRMRIWTQDRAMRGTTGKHFRDPSGENPYGG